VLSQMGVDSSTAADWLDESESVSCDPCAFPPGFFRCCRALTEETARSTRPVPRTRLSNVSSLCQPMPHRIGATGAFI
jgi:hypothetical protein